MAVTQSAGQIVSLTVVPGIIQVCERGVNISPDATVISTSVLTINIEI